jgi:hypothetical protein
LGLKRVGDKIRPRIYSLLFSVEQNGQAGGVWKERGKKTTHRKKNEEIISMILNTQKVKAFLANILKPHL